MEKCEICGCEAELRSCKIKDNLGTRYRKICSSCITSLSENGFVEILDKPSIQTQKIDIDYKDVDRILMTTGPDFCGYTIKEYKGIVFDETITGVGLKTTFKSFGDMFASLTGDQLYAVTGRINTLKEQQIERLKIKAAKVGANAIIAVDIECTMPGGSAIMVSANGTAVVIEKN